MNVILIHDHYTEKHLAEVREQMKALGAPKIHAVWMECWNAYAALEGCHRIRAAKELGLTPEIVPVEYGEHWTNDDGYTFEISELIDDAAHRVMIDFEDQE